MLFIAVTLWASLVLVVALGFVVGAGQTSHWLEAHHPHGGGWLIAGTAVEAGFAMLLLWMAWRSARTSGASFRNAVTFRGGANRYEAACIAVPVYSILCSAGVAAGYAVFLGREAAPFLFVPGPMVP